MNKYTLYSQATIVRLSLLTLAALLFVGCATKKVWINLNGDLEIPPSEIPVLKAKAQNGDSKAAVKLEQYYDYIVLDYAEGRKWLRLAAEQGDATAQYTLGLEYATDDFSIKNVKTAKYWFRLAEKNGCTEAKTALHKLAVGKRSHNSL